MNSRKSRLTCAIAALFFTLAAPAAIGGPALVDLNAAGAEGRMLAAQTGRWIVTETVWSAPHARPLVTDHLVAERRMVGNMLEETLSAPSSPTVLRRDFLTFHRVEGRWQYMSFDTRAAVGIMTAQSTGPEVAGTIEVTFQPFALPTDGAVTGQMLRMRQRIIRDGADHIIKDQYFTLADGRGEEWLAHRYDAVRQR
jgi:hypothetical protein